MIWRLIQVNWLCRWAMFPHWKPCMFITRESILILWYGSSRAALCLNVSQSVPLTWTQAKATAKKDSSFALDSKSFQANIRYFDFNTDFDSDEDPKWLPLFNSAFKPHNAYNKDGREKACNSGPLLCSYISSLSSTKETWSECMVQLFWSQISW